MNKNGSEPEVEIEVQVFILVHPWTGSLDTRNEGTVWRVKRKHGKWGKFEIKETRNLWQYGKHVYDESRKDDVSDGAESPSGGCMTDVDITLKGQRHRQPDRGGVENGRDELAQVPVDVTPVVLNEVVVVLQREEMNKYRKWRHSSKCVWYCHGSQDGVGRGTHVST